MDLTDKTNPLRNFWYVAAAGASVPAGRTLGVTLFGEELLVGRRGDGTVFAHVDSCPHRGMPMRHGGFDGQTLTCFYHGWKFAAGEGSCTAIPALAPDAGVDCTKFRLKSYPLREVQGVLWVYMGTGTPAQDPPSLPGFDGAAPQVAVSMRFRSGLDTAVMGFIDPAHPAFVHTSRWWKAKPAERMRLKEKSFAPEGMGFRMARHVLKHGANPYRLLGQDVSIDIGIQLPGIRTESIQGSRHRAGVLATATPVGPRETEVYYLVYWTLPWLAPLKPVARWMARDFLGQDRDAADWLDANPHPTALLHVGDPDAQVRWYLRLKREHAESLAEGRPFVNPLRPQTLHWRS